MRFPVASSRANESDVALTIHASRQRLSVRSQLQGHAMFTLNVASGCRGDDLRSAILQFVRSSYVRIQPETEPNNHLPNTLMLYIIKLDSKTGSSTRAVRISERPACVLRKELTVLLPLDQDVRNYFRSVAPRSVSERTGSDCKMATLSL